MPKPLKTDKHLILLIKNKAECRFCVIFIPHTLRISRQFGSFFSSLRRSLLATVLLPAALHAASGTSEQIDQAIEQHLSQAIATEAEAQSWRGMRFSHNSTPLNNTANLPKCTQALAVNRTDDSPSLLVRQRLEVRCQDQPGWTIVVSSQTSIFLPVVFTNRAIERGQRISAEQLSLQELDISKASRSFFNDTDDVVGMSAKRRIRANQALNPGLLAMPLLVKRGQQVKILANHDGIEASTLGEALENGQLNAVIRVKNVNSGKTIETKVLETGVVTSTFR